MTKQIAGTSTAPYAEVHKLRWPIEDDKGQKMTEIRFQTLTLDAVRAARKAHNIDEGDRSEQELNQFSASLICASTGLTESERGRLLTPDHNSLLILSAKLATQPASSIKDTPIVDDRVKLLVPVQDVELGIVDNYTLRPPTVRATELVKSQVSGFEQEVQLAAICTGLDVTTIRQLHMPDWVQLQAAVNDFLDEPAGFYLPQTSSD